MPFLSKQPRRWLRVLLAIVVVWLVADFTHSRFVAYRVARWEASVDRDADGVLTGCCAYTTGNGATALLFVHGINSSPRFFDQMAEALAKEHFTCRVTRLPGFAEPLSNYTVTTKEQWIAHLADELERLRSQHDTVVMVAHSLGGAAAIACVLENPGAANGVVLLAPAVRVSNRRSPILPTRTWHKIGNRTLLFTKVLWSPFGPDCHDKSVQVFPGRTPFTPRPVVDQLFDLMNDNRGRADEFTTPLLMVLSPDDRVIDWQAAHRFYDRSAGTSKRLVQLADSGHAIPLDYEWKNVCSEIAAFARRQAAK